VLRECVAQLAFPRRLTDIGLLRRRAHEPIAQVALRRLMHTGGLHFGSHARTSGKARGRQHDAGQQEGLHGQWHSTSCSMGIG
jgi:hypothetical protein